VHKYLVAAAALMVFSSAAMADVVSGAVVTRTDSGGLGGEGPGCLYVQYLVGGNAGRATMPLNKTPNTPQIVAATNIMTHLAISFTEGAANPGVCTEPGWEGVPTILFPGSP
jgi:hypothetical protein